MTFQTAPVRGQSITPLAGAVHDCGFDALHGQRMDEDPAYRAGVLAFEAQVLNGTTSQFGGGTYRIPVVVHIMESGNGLTDITDEEVRAAIKALNERFRKVPGSVGDGGGVDTGIEFVLAVRDPSGNCTTGITRYDLSWNATYVASGVFRNTVGIADADLKSYRVWDQSEYYNIWAVSEIDGNNGGSGIAGYAYFASSHGGPLDGTVLHVNTLRDTGSNTLVHELGHALNVYHTFEGDANGTTCPSNTNCATNGDRVCDTPPHVRSAGGCDAAGTNACDGGSSNALFVHNYMDYSSSGCTDMFTGGQVARMTPAIAGSRSSFLAVNGNQALVPPAAPQLDIEASASIVCGTGQSVLLMDRSSCLPNTYLNDSDLPGISYGWTFTNGVSTYTSSAQNPTFTPATAGSYSATMTVTTSLGTYVRTEPGIVVVTAGGPVAACTPGSFNPPANYGLTVSNVSFHTFSNVTSSGVNGEYQDFSCSSNTVVEPGGTYTLSVTLNGSGGNTQIFQAYIDYNNNGLFENPAELVGSGSANAAGVVVTTNVTIPPSAVQDFLLRMRVYGEVGGLSANERNCLADLLVGDVEDYGVLVTEPASVSVSPVVALDGPYDPSTGLMDDLLRGLAGFPTAQPYGVPPFGHGGTESVLPAVLATSGPNAIVDWVLVELRSDVDPSVVAASRAALLQRDGDVVDLDGLSPVLVDLPPGSYHVAVRHRNHLGVMTQNALALTSTPATVDFRSAGTATHGTNARKSVSGAFPAQVLWSGNVTADGQVKYTGTGNDRDPILQAIGGVVPTNTANGYLGADVDMNGQAKYTGADNDRDIILQNIGGVIPTNTRVEQLP